MTADINRHSSATWIDDAEKYAVIALRVKLDDAVPFQAMTPHHWVFTDTGFEMPNHWREWLGTVRTEELEKSNLFLLSKIWSERPELLDAEIMEVKRHAMNFYAGLLLASPFVSANNPVVLTGYRQRGEINVHSLDKYNPAISSTGEYMPVKLSELKLAAGIASQIAIVDTAAVSHWRLFRILHLYLETRTIRDNMDRLHQYCRCIEGLIVSEPGKGKRRFKGRTELFIGPGHHSLMEEMYDLRSDVEHLYENKYLEVYDRATRLDLIRKLMIAEYIVRSILARILLNDILCRHFANTDALKAFWALSNNEQRLLWGDPINPFDAVADFDPQYISDAQLDGP